MAIKKINVTQTFLPPLKEYTDLLKKIWETKHLTNRGEYVIDLEEKIQEFLGSNSKPLAVCNGTIALQIAIKALELKGEIITTPFSYVATTSSIVWEECKPVFVDIHPDYLTIDETKIEAQINKNTSAILATHVYGNPCNVEVIDKIAKKYNLKVIYDAAHCFGVKYKGKSIFDYGDISICSFHATKIFHTGEGGSIFCNNESLTKRIFDLHNFGHLDKTSFSGIGINGKMSELNAAIGLTVLPYMDQIIINRNKIAKYYNSNIDFNSVKMLKLREDCSWNYSYYPIIFNKEKDLLKIQRKLNNNNILPRRYFYPSLNTLNYAKGQSMRISEEISTKVLCLPIYPELTSFELQIISNFVNLAK